MEGSPPGFSVYVFSLARIPEFPTPVDLPNTEIKPMSLASPTLAGRFFTTEPPGKLHIYIDGGIQE